MILGLDLSRRDVACVLSQNDGATVLALRAPLPENADSVLAWRALIDVAEETMIRSMQPRQQITMAVLAFDAQINSYGVVEKSPGSVGWYGFDIPTALHKSLGIPNTFGLNRIVCEGAGEAHFGALRDAETSTRWLYVHLGSRVGAAMRDRFVDIGEVVIERDGALGSSGRRGTLEAYCTAENFLARAAGYGITLRQEHEIWEMAKSNFAAQSLCDDFVRRLCHGIGTTWTLLQPVKIVLGGSLAVALGDELIQQVRRGLHEFCAYNDDTAVVAGTLGHDAAVLGAVAVAGQRLGAMGDGELQFEPIAHRP